MSAGVIWDTLWSIKLSEETSMIDFYGPQWEDASWIVSGKIQFQHNTHSRHYLQKAGYFHSNAL